MWSLLLNKYVLGALGAALAVFYIWHKGYAYADTRWQAKMVAAQEERIARLQKWGEADRKASAELDTKLKAELAKERALREKLARMLNAYVTPTADAGCVITNGVVLHHNAAASDTDLPDASREFVDAASAVALSDYAGTVSENYATCHETASRLRSLQNWLKDVRDRWSKEYLTR